MRPLSSESTIRAVSNTLSRASTQLFEREINSVTSVHGYGTRRHVPPPSPLTRRRERRISSRTPINGRPRGAQVLDDGDETGERGSVWSKSQRGERAAGSEYSIYRHALIEFVDEETGTTGATDRERREHPDPGDCPWCEGDPVYLGRYGFIYVFECRDCKGGWCVVDPRGDVPLSENRAPARRHGG